MAFKDDMVTDLDIFFNTDEFAEDFTTYPRGMTSDTLVGIWDEPGEILNPVTGGVETTAPTILTTLEYVDGLLNHGDLITRDSTNTRYEIIRILPEDRDTIRLYLSLDEVNP